MSEPVTPSSQEELINQNQALITILRQLQEISMNQRAVNERLEKVELSKKVLIENKHQDEVASANSKKSGTKEEKRKEIHKEDVLVKTETQDVQQLVEEIQ